jgi:DNA-directed RNA polymerase specialized sigma24 family protein
MAAMTLNFDTARNQLSRTIMETVNSWPELQRRIFVSVHYCGKSTIDTATALGVDPAAVAQALHDCEQRLHLALKPFREAESNEASYAPRHAPMHASACCFH